MFKRTLAMLALTVAPAAMTQAQSTQPATAQTEVPVKAVVLFSSGVGYFEHFGTVRGNGQTELRFKTSQINDILKSLVLQDLDGGSVSTITYPSQDPISKTLRSFQVDITNNPPLADLLNQLRGAKVKIQAQAEQLTGTILGVEKKRKPVEKGEPVEVSVLNLLTGAMIRSVDLDQINTLELEDPALQEELHKALTALAQARDQDKKPVTINFQGQGDRRVRIGYVVETPVWKTSYRLILQGQPAKGESQASRGPATTQASQDGKLQGWAIVENQTDSDWNNAQLSLVSGRPISFIMDLYQPLYAPRPTVVPELFASLRPQVYDAGIAREQEEVAFTRARSGDGVGQFGGGRGGRGGAANAPAAAPALQQLAQQGQQSANAMAKDAKGISDVTASVQSVASAARIGELFQYTVGDVTLPRQKSAMLPIITDNVEVERLSIYNASVLPKNPLNGARLKNTTDKHLLQGPVTVLEGSSYAGDAQIDNVPPGQERLLSYGIDLQMLVDNTKNSSDSAIVSGKIVKGVLQISRRHQAVQEYLSDNKSDHDKTLIIEHPIRHGWKLVDTESPIETTPNLYRFKGVVPAGKSARLAVKEEIVQGEVIAILPTDVSGLAAYAHSGEIPQKVRDALTQAIQLKQTLADTERQIAEKVQQISENAAEQGRVRENLRTLTQQQSQPYQRQLTKLNDIESQIEKLQSERDDLIKKRDTQRKELEDYLSGLDVG
jgi:hypothetical protein